jgi:hypothetical protein
VSDLGSVIPRRGPIRRRKLGGTSPAEAGAAPVSADGPCTVSPPRDLSTASAVDPRVTALVLGAIVVGAFLRFHGAMVSGEVGDVVAYRNHVEVLRHGDSVYRQTAIYPYFPGWLDLEWASWLVSEYLKVPFGTIIHLLVVAADVLTCFAIWWTATLVGGPARGRWAAAIYAVNPIAIVISGYHGQIEAIPTFLTVLAAGLIARRKSPGLVGVLVGAAIAVKPHPTLLVPVFLRAQKLTLQQRIILLGAIVLALGAIVVVSVGTESLRAIQSVLGYGGGSDQGIGGLLRGLWLYRAHNLFLPGDFGQTLGKNTRWLALALMTLSWLLTWKQSVARSSAAVFLAFLAVFGAISTQYLLWPLAWLLLSDVALIWSVIYGVGVTIGAIGYYLVYWPQIILGSAGNGGPWPAFATTYVEGEVISWVTILVVFFVTIGRPRSAGRWWRPAVTVASLACAIAAYPVLGQIAWLTAEWIKFRG